MFTKCFAKSVKYCIAYLDRKESFTDMCVVLYINTWVWVHAL